jgi:hypothetical protein
MCFVWRVAAYLSYFSTRSEMVVKELDFGLIMVSHVNDLGQTRGSRFITRFVILGLTLYVICLAIIQLLITPLIFLFPRIDFVVKQALLDNCTSIIQLIALRMRAQDTR